ncbi:Conserved_hypothetical protein [Hexamita inflata]|uniref:Uncharacterized protein n=1 Tax=Hexamita inflata TaxID=28002 RepID=A0AA86QTI3_9EUKA|nr:Conserved hypothetical protein [Hexamita inflata]
MFRPNVESFELSQHASQIAELQRQQQLQQQQSSSNVLKLEQQVNQLERQLNDTQMAIVSLAHGYYELQDLTFMMIQHPKLYKQIKRGKMFIPMRQLHPDVYARPGRPIRNNIPDIIQSCVSQQKGVIEENIFNGFASQAATAIEKYQSEKQNQFSTKFKQQAIQLGGTLIGLLLTIYLLIIKLIKRPEIILEILAFKYNLSDYKQFVHTWFPMLFGGQQTIIDFSKFQSTEEIGQELFQTVAKEMDTVEEDQMTAKRAASVAIGAYALGRLIFK